MAKLLKGIEVAQHLEKKLIQRIENLHKKGINPCLAIIRIGEEQVAITYETNIARKCKKVGVNIKQFYFEKNIRQSELLKAISYANRDNNIHGILLLRPLPKHLNEQEACFAISPDKDVDGVTNISMADIYGGGNVHFAPCTAESCIQLLNYYEIPISGKKIVIVGRSLIVGRPLAMLLLKEDATVTICHSKTQNLQEICKGADILMVALGKPEWIDSNYVAEGQTILDIGINVTEKGKLCGDVNFREVEDKVGAITTVPGGIGTITSTILVYHVVLSAEKLS